MPLVAHSNLPTFDSLRAHGEEILSLDRALSQDIRELHIGLLNMMPDKAVSVTENQFMRLVGGSNQIAQFYVHPFSIEGIERGPEMQAYIDEYYETFAQIREKGLDALIITGANPATPILADEPFYESLREVIEWAKQSVTSVICSCLATHALMQQLHGETRRQLPRKKWGVYSHRVTGTNHPLLRGINTRFDVPHSRNNTISREQFVRTGHQILVESREAGVHLAVSKDLFRRVYFQGHPEYFINSLLKEYKREVQRYFRGDRAEFPPPPENYLTPEAASLITEFWFAVTKANEAGTERPPFPEKAILAHLDNTWVDTGKAIFNNWLGLVYQLTHVDRTKPFHDNIDPNDPLNMRGKLQTRPLWNIGWGDMPR